MASMSTHIPNSSDACSSKTPNHKYDIFLSFRGKDVRDNFLEYLYRALLDKGILTFKDEPKLEDGERINDGLLKAIEESKISIVVLSKNYADSSWCLRELVHILKCKRDGLLVYPIFYHVTPSDVRKQNGAFGEGFAKTTKTSFLSKLLLVSNKEEVKIWRNALEEVGNLKGWDYPNAKFETEASLIDNLVHTIFCKSIGTYRVPGEDLVGIKYRMGQVIELLNLGLDETQVVGLCGMGGIGKTTLAGAVYGSISWQFEGCCFIDNVREVFNRSGVLALQEKLISDILGKKDFNASSIIDATNIIQKNVCRKKVLIVFDDVSEPNQVEDLVNELHRFGRGCRIIITTRNEHVLTVCRAQAINVQGLKEDEAIQLFKSKAFTENGETKDFQGLIGDAVEYAKGLPLALKVLGSFLSDKTVSEWGDALDSLRESPDDEVQRVLKISYDGLSLKEKEIFLDMACFFTGENKDRVINILNSCGFNPVIGVRVLVQKSLLTISEDNYLQMHDLVQQMGRSIVVEQSIKEPGERSRLWRHEDIKQILVENTGTNKVEGISYRDSEYIQLRPDAFAKMRKLRFLEVRATCCSIDLPNNLRCLVWAGYPLRSMPSTFQPEHLVELHLINSHIEQLWDTTMYQFGSRSLTRVEVSNIDTLENLANAEASSLLFTTLKTLSLENMDNLQLSHSPLVVIVRRFKNLTDLCVSKCHQLKNLFLLSVTTEFMHLKKIVIKDCKNMEEVFWKEHREDETNKLVFPKLEELKIDDLPSLVSFCRGIDEVVFHQLQRMSLMKLPKVESLFSGMSNQSFFPHKVSFPRMMNIGLYNMENMKEIWCGQLQSGSFCNLMTLGVTCCHKLRVVFTSSAARDLVHLHFLFIQDCSLLEIVVTKEEEEEDGVEDTTLFPELGRVELNELPALESFCHVAHDLECPKLSFIRVINCPELKTFSSGFVCTPKLKNVRLTEWNAEKEVTLWEDNLNSTIECLHKQYQFGSRSLIHFEVSDMNTLENLANAEASSLLFTTLETLSLENMNNLQQLSHSPLVVIVRRFKNLTGLCVSKCHQLKNLFLLSVATEFMHLKKIVIKDCKNMEEVIGKEHREDETNKLVFPKLEWLRIDDLPSLVSFCRGIDEVEFHQLEIMSLKKLPKVESLFSGMSNQSFFPHKVSFPSMKSIWLYNMENMKEIWCGQLQSGSFCNLTYLHVIGCHKLRAMFTPSQVRYLLHLQYLSIKDCSFLEIVVAKEEEEDGVEDTTLLPELNTVELNELPVLESFCHVAHDLEYPELRIIRVIKCPELKTFSPGFVRTPELENVMLTELNAEKQVTLWEDNLNSTIEHLHKQHQEEQRQHEDGIEEENIEG